MVDPPVMFTLSQRIEHCAALSFMAPFSAAKATLPMLQQIAKPTIVHSILIL
jgi:hypothetical protein